MAVIFMGSFFHLPPTSQKFGGILLCITFSNSQLSFHGGTIILLQAKWFNLQNTQQNSTKCTEMLARVGEDRKITPKKISTKI